VKKPAMVPRHAAIRRPASAKYWGMARNHLYSGFQRSRRSGQVRRSDVCGSMPSSSLDSVKSKGVVLVHEEGVAEGTPLVAVGHDDEVEQRLRYPFGEQHREEADQGGRDSRTSRQMACCQSGRASM
jgi:hypothetical protein